MLTVVAIAGIGGAAPAGAVVTTFTTGPITVAIPDGATATADLIIPTAGLVTDVDVSVRIDHDNVGDLDLSLVHPDGFESLLAADLGGDGDDFGTGAGCTGTSTTFDDEHVPAMAAAAPFATTLNPAAPLSSHDLRPSQGTWKLAATDDTANGIAGTILCFQLAVDVFTPGGTTFTVSTAADTIDFDDGVISLREAFLFADGDGADSVVVLGSDPTYQLTRCDDTYSSRSVKIGASQALTVRGNGSKIENTCPTGRVVSVGPAAGTTLIERVVLAGGASSGGAGLRNEGTATTIRRSTITGNAAPGDAGGVLNTGGTLIIEDSTVSMNTAGDDGAGVQNVNSGVVTIQGSTIANNTADDDGGGVRNLSGKVTVIGSTLSANRAGPDPGDDGGGLRNIADGADAVTIVNSTIDGNSAGHGAAVSSSQGTVTLIHATITDNATAIAGNGDIDRTDGTIAFTATAVALSAGTGGNCSPGTGGTSNGFNFGGDGTCTAFGTPTDTLDGGDPEVGPLTTASAPVRFPMRTSPLFNRIPPGSCTQPTDSRGVSRPQEGMCEIGAAEVVVDTVGLVDPTQGQWHLRNSQGTVTTFFYGDPDDVPFVGDWNCDGTQTPGLFRQSDAFAYLRDSNTAGIGDIRFFFGDPADVPLAGDFDGDGCDTLSIYRPAEGRFFIINQLGENEGGLGAAEFDFSFGDLGDKPVVGDWDGDGIDEVGLHRESTGLFYWRTTLTTGIADGSIIFGDPDDRFVSGDWGLIDGADTPALFRPATTTFFFRHTLSQGIADAQFPFGQPPWLPVAGKFALG